MTLGQYHKIKCPTCSVSVEISKPEEVPERCPACDAHFGDALSKQGGGTGLTTANTYYEGINTN